MKFANGIYRFETLTVFLLIILFCSSCYEQDEPVDGELVVALPLLYIEYLCSLPNAVDYGVITSSKGRYCITNKLSSDLIYNHLTNNKITVESVVNGTQLQCRNALWFKSDIFPIPNGHRLSYVGIQPANRDLNGDVISYLPFTDYTINDTLICLNSSTKIYQIIRIQ